MDKINIIDEKSQQLQFSEADPDAPMMKVDPLTEEDDEHGEQTSPKKRRGTVRTLYHILIALIVLIVVVTTVALAILLSPSHQIPVDRKNILVIIADDLGYNDLGYFNGEFNGGEIKTPYIDRLARESVQLRRHYAQPMCSPSRAAFFTGRYPFRYGMSGARAVYYGSRNGLNTSETLLPQVLQDFGYKTYLIGKWHLGFAEWAMTPLWRGFDYFYGMYGGSTYYYTHMSYEGPRKSAYDLFEDQWNNTSKILEHSVVDDPNPNGTFVERLLTKKAEEVLDQHAGLAHKTPFFMVMSYSNPHAPIEPMERDIERNSHIANENRRKMAAMITSLDFGVGTITTKLERLQLLNDTIILFFSDNGGQVVQLMGESYGSSNYPLRGAKMTLYEGGIRTPAFLRIPGFNKSKIYDGMFHVSDWFPTLLSLAKSTASKEVEKSLDGKDHSGLFEEILGGGSPAHLRESVVGDIDPVYNNAVLIRDKFKLIVGNPAPLNFDQVYPLISEETEREYPGIVLNSTHYKVDASILMRQLHANSLAILNYVNNSTRCLSLDCMSRDLTLYDLSVDIGEGNDISDRFTAIRDEMYEELRNFTREDMVSPIYFEDENEEALMLIDDSEVWTPWL